MIFSDISNKASVCFAFASIAALPYFFVRVFDIGGLQFSVFHLVAIPFILLSLCSVGFQIDRPLHIIEKSIILFIVALTLYVILVENNVNGIKFLIKTLTYAVYSKLLYVVLSSIEQNQRIRCLRATVNISLIVFVINLGLGYGIAMFDFPFSKSIACPPVGLFDTPVGESLANIEDAKGLKYVVWKFTVPALAAFDEIWSAKPICLSRDIGLNALAGVFLLYLNIIILSRAAAQNPSLLSVATVLVLIVLMDSLGTLGALAIILICAMIVWLYLEGYLTHIRFRQILIYGSVALVVMGMFIVPEAIEQGIGSARIAMYQTSIELIKKSPLIGYGLGLKIKTLTGEVYPHNFVLSAWLMMGVSGLLAALGLVLVLIRQFMKAVISLVSEPCLDPPSYVLPAFLISPVFALMIRSSIESIFMHSDWASLAIYLSFYHATHKKKARY